DEPPGCDAVIIPVNRNASWILFAHAQLSTALHEGDPPGRVIARYVFHLAGGRRIEAPIRERFEISVVPVAWGEHPFLAVPDSADSLMARYEGKWESTGFRQTEARQAWPHDYYLWTWKNPHPEAEIERIEVLPG